MRFAISRTYDSFDLGHLKTKFRFLGAALCLTGTVLGFSTPAKAGVFDPLYADPYFNCTTGSGCCLQADALIRDMFRGTGLYTGQADLQQNYYIRDLFRKIETALQQMSRESLNVMTAAAVAKGGMLDGQTLNLTLLSLGKQNAESIIKETSSDQICRFGTLSRSLANSDDKARVVQLGLSTEMLQRETMHSGLASGYEKGVGTKIGRTTDKASRFSLYKSKFCDPTDSNGAIKDWCTTTNDTDYNGDIDPTRSLYHPMTLKLDFDGGAATNTDDEQKIMALASNLFAHDLPLNFSAGDINAIRTDIGSTSEARVQKLMDYRSLVAKRTVAQNSFAAITAMKAEGGGESATFMKEMLNYLGITDAGAQTAYLGDKPSYYAQMDFLTRKLYQSPEFYANLMESPENVQRQQTAMEGIALMQDRDIYKSLSRSEMVLSSLLEMYIVQQQSADKDKGTKAK